MVDGDTLLLVSDKTFIEIAERNMKDIVPLYYDMKKASPVILNNQSIYEGLKAAFVSGNIGIYSNNISKIWNSEVFINGTQKEKKEAIDVVKLLCMENNFVIDGAKTLYIPKRPEYIKDKIKKYTNCNVPYFFTYAKDKNIQQVEERNKSFVNKLEDKIVNPRINCRKLGLGEIYHFWMMSNRNIECKVSFLKNGKIDENNTDPLIVKYLELSKNCYYNINYQVLDKLHSELLTNSELRQHLMFCDLVKNTKKELSQFGYNENEIVDILVEFLYDIKPNKYKILLWNCYGDILYNNLLKHIKPKTKSIQCVDCGKWFEVDIKNRRACCCNECKDEHRKSVRKSINKRYYLKNKN